MTAAILHKHSSFKQYLIAISGVILLSLLCFFISSLIGYKVVALILLCYVSVVAMFFDILPVMITAVLSAVIWNFFFIPPTFTFYIGQPEDFMMFLLYFFIALINVVLNHKNRQWERIARQREEKRNAYKLYNTLLNSLSHELRTPIATIIGSTDNLQTDNGKLSGEDRNELINSIAKAALRLNGNVENLLNMSRLESGIIKPVKDWCDVNDMLHEVKNQLKDLSNEHTIEVVVQPNLTQVKIDSGLIGQAILNLLYNALLYTPPKSKISIHASKQNRNLVITVSDNGKGFPENEIEQVFDKFYRLKDSKTGGTGLGLSIVKGFVEANGGNILLENIASGGARFTLIIPLEN